MGTVENKELVRRFIDEVVNTGDVDRVGEFVSPDCIETDGKVRVASGIDGLADHIRGVRATYLDLQLSVERQIAEDDWVVTQITARGTHGGEWLGIRPTGRQLVFTGVNVDRVVGGRIVEHGGAANMLEPLLEAGALRPAAEAQAGEKEWPRYSLE
jgi:predicted ester cyclase